MPRRRPRRSVAAAPVVVIALAALAGCTSSDGEVARAAGDGALVAVQHDVSLGFAEPDGATDDATYLRLAVVAPDGTPLTITSRGDGTAPRLLRGLEATPSSALDALGQDGVVTGAAVAPDGTLVVLGARDGAGAVVLRVGTDDAVTELPTQLAPDSAVNGVVAFSPDASRLVVARSAPSAQDPQLFVSGEVEVVGVDTTTGRAVAGPVLLPFTEPTQRIPGRPDAAEPRALAVAADGSAALAVDVRASQADRSAQLLRLDAGLQRVGEPVPLPVTGERDARALALRPDGTLYATVLRPDPDGDQPASTGWDGAFVLLRLAAGGAQAEEVVAVPKRSTGLGMAVPGDGRWAYLGGSFAEGRSADFLPVDLTTGTAAAAVEVCDDGLVGDPVADPTGTHLVVSGTCDVDQARAAHVYVLGAAG